MASLLQATRLQNEFVGSSPAAQNLPNGDQNWLLYVREPTTSSHFCGGKLDSFLSRPGDVSSHFCGNQNRYSKTGCFSSYIQSIRQRCDERETENWTCCVVLLLSWLRYSYRRHNMCAEAKKLFKKHCWENQTEWEKSLLIKVVWFEEISNI